MKRITDFYKTHKYAIIWTLCYIAFMWAILLGLFNFDMFLRANWIRLAQAELRGFPGFVFGILILSALPIYIATTSIIVRTKKPLFTIPLPKIKINPAEKNKDKKEDCATPEPDKTIANITAQKPEQAKEKEENAAQKKLPSELKQAFLRASQNLGLVQTAVFNQMTTPNQNLTQNAPTDTDDASTTDFNFAGSDFGSFDDEDATDALIGNIDNYDDAPQFSDISFDAPKTTAKDTVKETCELLTKNNHQISETLDDIIITNRIALAVHDDSNFWIADQTDWFAAGQHKPSPVQRILEIGQEKNLSAVLYLKESNIMDLSDKIKEWESNGVIVIQDLSELKA